MHNTYEQAAAKIGITVRNLRHVIARRQIGILNFGHRTKRITDAEISRFIEKRTRRAIV